VQYTVKELSPVEFTMRDINGKLIEIQQNIIVQSGSGEFNWTIKNSTPPGIYFISMQQKGEKVAVCKVVKTNIN
jgi:hypothetical protein